MFKILKYVVNSPLNKEVFKVIQRRTFLSQAYYCNEVWENRFKDPILNKVKVEDFYQEIDLRHSKTGEISAIDVDIFANSVNDDTYTDELLDLAYKLRLSADTSNTLKSTPHAIVRYLQKHNQHEELLNVLDDRLNYGIFLDHYTANLLMDTYYKKGDFASGARVASQLMLQEDFDHPLSSSLALLHCVKFLQDPKGWPEYKPPEEPEEEIKIRVKYLRNPYFDDHFDLNDPYKIVGKTIWMLTKNVSSNLEKSLHLIGLILHEKLDRANNYFSKLNSFHAEVIKLLPEGNEFIEKLKSLPDISENIQEVLESSVKTAERATAENDIAKQCDAYEHWINTRKEVLSKHQERLRTQKRLADIEVMKEKLKERETKLWFFENEEKIELTIEDFEAEVNDNKEKETKVTKADDENYIPPNV